MLELTAAAYLCLTWSQIKMSTCRWIGFDEMLVSSAARFCQWRLTTRLVIWSTSMEPMKPPSTTKLREVRRWVSHAPMPASNMLQSGPIAAACLMGEVCARGQ